MAYSKKLNLVFIHIPKNAGTSIIEAMRKIDPGVKHGHTKWTAYATNIGPPASFAIVRNPWDRVVSCWKYANDPNSYWHGPNKPYGTHPDYNLLRKYSFADGVRILYQYRALLDKAPEQRPNFKHNWDYQYSYIYENARTLKVDQVLRFELLDEVTSYLKTVYGLDIDRLNYTDNSKSYREYFDDETSALVAEIYKKDIELFGYSY